MFMMKSISIHRKNLIIKTSILYALNNFHSFDTSVGKVKNVNETKLYIDVLKVGGAEFGKLYQKLQKEEI